MRRELKIQSVKVKDKVSYAEAARRVGGTERSGGGNVRVEAGSGNAGNQRQKASREKESRAQEEKKELVIFIAGVINATAEVKSKTERIQIITKAAIQHLGLIGLKWEEIREGLSGQPNQEAGSVG